MVALNSEIQMQKKLALVGNPLVYKDICDLYSAFLLLAPRDGISSISVPK